MIDMKKTAAKLVDLALPQDDNGYVAIARLYFALCILYCAKAETVQEAIDHFRSDAIEFEGLLRTLMAFDALSKSNT